MSKKVNLVCLDVGEKRIGVAIGNNQIRIAIPFDTIEVDGSEIEKISEIVSDQDAEIIVVGYPRNQSGDATKQTEYVQKFSERLDVIEKKVVFQDESLTSVMAEQRLISYKKPYSKADIDAQAAAIILQDFMEINYAR